MFDGLLFKSFCMSAYMHAKALSGKETFELFEKYGVFNYIDKVADVLHSTGEKYIVEDIDLYIQERLKNGC